MLRLQGTANRCSPWHRQNGRDTDELGRQSKSDCARRLGRADGNGRSDLRRRAVELESSRRLADARQAASRTRRPVIREWPVDPTAPEYCAPGLNAAFVNPTVRRRSNCGSIAGHRRLRVGQRNRPPRPCSTRGRRHFNGQPSAGVAPWLVYGITLASAPIIICKTMLYTLSRAPRRSIRPGSRKG